MREDLKKGKGVGPQELAPTKEPLSKVGAFRIKAKDLGESEDVTYPEAMLKRDAQMGAKKDKEPKPVPVPPSTVPEAPYPGGVSKVMDLDKAKDIVEKAPTALDELIERVHSTTDANESVRVLVAGIGEIVEERRNTLALKGLVTEMKEKREEIVAAITAKTPLSNL